MPLTQLLKLQHWTISLQALSIFILLIMGSMVINATPSKVLMKLEQMETQQRIGNERFSAAIKMNQDELKHLKKEMELRIKQLRQANDQLKKLDPTFVPEYIPDYNNDE